MVEDCNDRMMTVDCNDCMMTANLEITRYCCHSRVWI